MMASPTEISELELQDSTGRPVSGARLFLGELELAETDANGRFRLSGAPAAPFELTVFDARGAWLGRVLVSDGGDRVLRLGPATEERVTVRGAVPAETQSAPAAAVSVITEREIRESRPNQLANALVLVPGSGSLEEGHSVVPTLRGMARGRTLILLDGGRVIAERRAGPSATYLDPMTLDSVEVSRGPGSVAYGSDAFGGVINVTTKSPSVSGFAGQFSAAGRTVDDSVTGNLALDVPIGSSGLLFQGHWRNFDDYDSPEGVIENSAAEFYGWSARGLVPLGAAGLTLGFDYDRGRDIGKPATDSHVTRAFYPLENSSRASFDLDFPATFGFDEIGIQGFWGTYRLVTDRERQPTATVTKRLARSDVDADDASLRAVGTRALGAGRLRTGIDFNTRFDLHADGLTVNYDAQGNPTGEVPETSIENAQRLDVGGFLEADQPLLDGKVLAAGGLRGDWVQSQNFGGYFGTQSVTHGAFSGYAAATYSPKPSWSATFQYAHGFRDPTLSDRYFRGVSGRGFLTGNPDLDPETSDHLDLAIRSGIGSSLRLAAYGYMFWIGDLIERYQQGDDFFFRNRGKARFEGIELEADFDIARGWTLRATGTYAYGVIVVDDSPAADVPAQNVTLSVTNRPSERIWWSLRGRAVRRDGRPGPVEVVTPGFATLDVLAGWEFVRGFQAQALLTNLFDEAYRETPDPVAVLAPGRAFSLALSGRF